MEVFNNLCQAAQKILGSCFRSTLNRFASADTIVPDPANPQSFNRYSYGYNNPIKYSDPSGHISCDVLGTEECTLDEDGNSIFVNAPPLGPDPEPPILFKDQTWDSRMYDLWDAWILNPRRTEPIVFRVPWAANAFVTIMPVGLPPNLGSFQDPSTASTLDELGLLADYAEILAIASQQDGPILDYLISLVDIGLTGGSCMAHGECYIGRPHPSLPEMLVFNQDLVVSGGDFVVPPLVGLFTGYPGTLVADFVTSVGSALYDLNEINGAHNYMSVGMSEYALFILIYPSEPE